MVPKLSMISLRKATLDDADRLFRWRNDPGTRVASWNGGEVGWEDHCAWLNSTLENPDRVLLVAEQGTVRLDRHEDGWEVSATLAPEFRGKGMAKDLILAGCRYVGRGPYYASIKEENQRSVRAFEAAGFSRYLPNWWRRTDAPAGS